MTMRKILPIGIGLLTLSSIIAFSFYTDSSSKYTPRQNAVSQGNEPHSMDWAHVDGRTGELNPAARLEAFNEIRNSSSRAGALGLTFENLGPDNVGGRTRAILEVFGKPDTLLVGSVTGGVFISYDGGGIWEPHTQFQNLDSSSSIISCIHQDTTNGRIYIGTGSSFEGEKWPGFGIFYSDDNGINFKHLSSTTPISRFTQGGSPWLYVNRIRTDGAGNVYAATGMGLLKSTDRGETWDNIIFLDNGNTIPSTATYADVVAMKSGRVIASTTSGAIYISDDGLVGTFQQVSQTGMPSSGMGRTVLAASAQNEDHMFAMFMESGDGCLNSVYESITGGEFWTKLLVNHDDFKPMYNGQYCQGIYDACLEVSPINENLFFLGGITLWRYDGNLTRVATEGGSPPIQDVLPNYVHADKHYIYFSPNDPRRVYVTTDGGIAMSENDGQTWRGLNKGYITTQNYAISHGNDGTLALCGNQDNGTLIVLGDNASDPKVGFQMTGGDGMGNDMSQMSSIIFTSSQNGAVMRIDAAQRNGSSFPVGSISGTGGPFVTRVRLWESINDPSSKDSVYFAVESSQLAIDVSNGIVRSYSANVDPIQPAAIVIGPSIKVYSGNQILTTSSSDSNNLSSANGSEGTITYNSDGSFDINVTFATAPSENSNIFVSFEQRFAANSVLILESNNLNSGLTSYQFEHRLENSLNPGDAILVQDPVQSLLASTGGAPASQIGGIRMYRNVLNFTENPVPIDIPGVSGSVSCLDFTPDGNHLFVGTHNGSLYRVSGLKNLYTAADLSQITVQNLPSASVGAGGITSVAVDPNNSDRVVVTSGGYGLSDRIKISTNALSGGTFMNIHGNLPRMPIYSAEIDRNDPNIIIVGTEFGLWATGNATDIAPTWSDENNQFSYVPVYDVRQQSLPWEQAKNTGTYFIGTYGRGMWKSSSLVGIKDVDPLPTKTDAISGLKVYPNPMKDNGSLELTTSFNGNVNMTLFDINGRQIQSWQERVASGKNTIQLNTMLLRSGNYYVSVQAGESRQVAKIMVLR